MQEEVTVNKAINKGKWLIFYIPLLIIFTSIAFTIFITSLTNNIILLLIGIFLSVPLGILFLLVMVTKWRLWAFENVRNVHELKKKAIREKIISSDGSWTEKFEIRTKAQKEKWDELLLKFNKEDIYEDDHSIPNETMIYLSKNYIIFGLFISIFMIGGALYWYITEQKIIISILLCLFGGYLFFTNLKNFLRKAPYLILSEIGITTDNGIFYSWFDIHFEDFELRQMGKHSSYF